MSNIIEVQDIIINKIEELIEAGTLDTDFTVQDNDIETGDVPLIIVQLGTSDVTNMGTGGTAYTGFNLNLKVIDKISNHSNVYRTTHLFIIEAFEIILDNIQCNSGKLKHDDGIYDGSKSAKVSADIEHYG